MNSSTARNALLAASVFVVMAMVGGGVAVRVGAADNTYRSVITFSEVLSLIRDNYVDPVEESALLVGAYEGLLGSLDGRGAYLSPPEVAAWKNPAAEISAATGMSVLKAATIVHVVAVAPGSPAEAAGIKPGDQVRRIDGRAVRGMSWDQVVRILRGAKGSTVAISLVLPREGFKREEREIGRAVLSGAPHGVRVEREVAIASVRDLARLSPETMRDDLRKARKDGGATRLLIDLRNTVEGTPRDVATVAGLFTTCPLLVLKDKSGNAVETVATTGDGTGWTGEIAVLVNGGTAGAAEALAQLLQSRRGATVYGEATFGLGAEPKLIELPDGAGLLIPAMVWETASGKRWNEDGVKPDREIKAEFRADLEPDKADADQLRRTLDEIVKDDPPSEVKPKAA